MQQPNLVTTPTPSRISGEAWVKQLVIAFYILPFTMDLSQCQFSSQHKLEFWLHTTIATSSHSQWNRTDTFDARGRGRTTSWWSIEILCANDQFQLRNRKITFMLRRLLFVLVNERTQAGRHDFDPRIVVSLLIRQSQSRGLASIIIISHESKVIAHRA